MIGDLVKAMREEIVNRIESNQVFFGICSLVVIHRGTLITGFGDDHLFVEGKL